MRVSKDVVVKAKHAVISDLPEWFISHPVALDILGYYYDTRHPIETILEELETENQYIFWVPKRGLYSACDKDQLLSIILENEGNIDASFVYDTINNYFVTFRTEFIVSPVSRVQEAL